MSRNDMGVIQGGFPKATLRFCLTDMAFSCTGQR